MSWELASFARARSARSPPGFAWYERTHPSRRCSRSSRRSPRSPRSGAIAFAPLPNVKPTTDIVLLAGYALGGAPGFAVGAVAALASNFFFGAGPVDAVADGGWGLRRRDRRRALARRARAAALGRVPLAVACGARRARCSARS